ncbi:tetratricopeptide repeat protein [uncultured Ruminococcus sp.]|uniref:tetratricopeptide repeat protein n=1 Tax=uncultured Ruminococcus sp. TaxID=165186 RepID=UPI0025FD6B32|nr:tetratricopeptide repeat protein [uncultured Ruminococcus sp.]
MDNNLEGLVADSRLAFIQGKYEVSLKLAKQALDQDSNSPDAHQCAGNAYMSKADYESAINHYKKALENDADNGDRYFNLGYAYASDNQPVKALEMFAKADEVGCSPNVVGQLYKIMAMLCFDMHRYNDAVLNFIKSEKIIGIDMEVLQRKALSYSMSGDTIAGIEVANQMKLLAPTDYLGYRIAFNILLQEERLEEAEKELNRAERFAKPSKDLFMDWIAYETARYQLDHDQTHLTTAIDKIYDGLCMLEPSVDAVIESYVTAADLYVQLEDADMALKCLNAAENPIYAFNSGFSVKIIPELEIKSEGRPSERQIDHAIQAVRRKYGDRRLEVMGRELTSKARKSATNTDNLTPVAESLAEDTVIPKLDSSIHAEYTTEMLDRIYRLYVAAYTINNDIVHIKAYASKLANSSDPHSKYIGKYSLIKALRDEGYEKADEEYRDFLKFLRNEMIKDPSDMMALSFRVQCHVDLGEFDEAEKLCKLLADDLAQPLREQINEARSGGDA